MKPSSEPPIAEAEVIPLPVTPSINNSNLNDNYLSRLREQGFPKGLAQDLYSSSLAFSLRIWIVDNSGSMNIGDGSAFTENEKGEVEAVSCSRWNEIQETVIYHAKLAALLRAPTIFRILNPCKGNSPEAFSVADKGDEMIDSDVSNAIDFMRNTAAVGTTPLTRHVNEIRDIVHNMLPTLTSEGKRIAIVLATDGLPSDYNGFSGAKERNEFIESLKSLEGLPIWIVIRLCTGEESIVDFYNNLDTQLEYPIEVLDDFVAEAKEIRSKNIWLNYSLPLHRCREMGYKHRMFDLLDERRLTLDELRQFCFLLFGDDNFEGVPLPSEDWKSFSKSLAILVNKEQKQVCGTTGINGKFKRKYLISMNKLRHEYSDYVKGCVLC